MISFVTGTQQKTTQSSSAHWAEASNVYTRPQTFSSLIHRQQMWPPPQHTHTHTHTNNSRRLPHRTCRKQPRNVLKMLTRCAENWCRFIPTQFQTQFWRKMCCAWLVARYIPERERVHFNLGGKKRSSAGVSFTETPFLPTNIIFPQAIKLDRRTSVSTWHVRAL